MARDPDFFKRIYQKNITGQVDKEWIEFYVPIGSAKEPSQDEFYPD